MAFKTSTDVFDAVFGRQEKKNLPEQYLTEIAKYLQTRTHVPGAVALGEWILSGKSLFVFTCREDMTETLAEKLRVAEVPYAVLFTSSGQMGFIIRSADGKKADEIKAATLIEASRTCRVVSGEDMINLAAASKAKDKSCLAFHGLSKAQAYYIRDGYAKRFTHPEIGLDSMSDGTYTLTIRAQDSIKQNTRDDTSDICTILLETIMKTGGPNGRRNTYYAEMEEDYRERLSREFIEEGVNMNRTPLWIIGKGNQFVKITAQGFSYGHAVRKDVVELKTELQVENVQPDFRQLLVSYTRRIPYKVFTYSSEAVIYHFSKKEEGEFDAADISPEPMYYVYNRGEQELAKTIDQIMTRKLHNEEIMIMDGRWHEKYARYMEEAQAVLRALAVGRLPAGYEPEDLIKIRSILEKYKMQADMYEMSIDLIEKIQAVPIIETIERVADVQKKLGITRETLEREKEKAREERAAKRGRTPAIPTAPSSKGPGTAGKDKDEEVER